MIVDGVNFIEPAVKSMTKEDFIARHVDVYYQDIGRRERKRKLADIYNMINGIKAKDGK